MGKRGPLPQASNVRQLRGNPGKRRPKMTAQALAVREAPAPPAWIRGEALAEWKRITPELKRLQIITQLDRAMLTVYCSSWAIMVEAAKALRGAW